MEKLLTRRRAGQHAQDRVGVFKSRHRLLDRRDDDMDPRQALREVAVALIGDDHRRAGLGNQQIGAGYADVGGEELFAQNSTRFGNELVRLLQHAVLR